MFERYRFGRSVNGEVVAVTSTLAVFEGAARPPMNSGIMKRSHELMSPQAWSKVMTLRANMLDLDPLIRTWLQKEMKFERNFVAAGGMLLAGCDPTGTGQTLAGLGDQRQVELLVEGGFTPVAAIHIATQNGATFLGAADRIGSVAAGKQADLVPGDRFQEGRGLRLKRDLPNPPRAGWAAVTD